MTSDLWAPQPRERIAAARALTASERHAILGELSKRAPYRPWPYGMPTSANPLVVVVGVSPGASPPSSGAFDARGYVPTFGEPAPGFFYPDTSHYWTKVRVLASELVRAFDPGLDDNDALSIAGHLNLGTGSFGRAGSGAVETAVVRWVSTAIASDLRPRVVVGLGLVGLVLGTASDAIRAAWNAGGLPIDWAARQVHTKALKSRTYRYHSWKAVRPDTGDVLVIFWPNHPSRVPFAGPDGPGSPWHESVMGGVELVRDLLLNSSHREEREGTTG